MRIVQATEAKAHLSELLSTVERGETIGITRHGRMIAQLIPAALSEHAERKKAVARFRRCREEWDLTNISVEEILQARHEGHRL